MNTAKIGGGHDTALLQSNRFTEWIGKPRLLLCRFLGRRDNDGNHAHRPAASEKRDDANGC